MENFLTVLERKQLTTDQRTSPSKLILYLFRGKNWMFDGITSNSYQHSTCVESLLFFCILVSSSHPKLTKNCHIDLSFFSTYLKKKKNQYSCMNSVLVCAYNLKIRKQSKSEWNERSHPLSSDFFWCICSSQWMYHKCMNTRTDTRWLLRYHYLCALERNRLNHSTHTK